MDYNLIGVPQNYRRTVNSGAGGNTIAEIVVPTGQIWIMKYMCAYHNDGAASRAIYTYLVDNLTAVVHQIGATATVTTGIQVIFPMATFKGPLVLASGCITIRILCAAMAAATDVIIDAHVHKLIGVSPLT